MSTLYADTPLPTYSDQAKACVQNIPKAAKSYVKGLFPIVRWLPNYNTVWLTGDLIAAVTAGSLIIPQGIAYAKIANLPPIFGLYTSFIGVITYPLLGTSKDISIATSAIMSLLVGQVVQKFTSTSQYISGEWTLSDIAITLCLFSGLICMFLGLLRLGPLFHFICQPTIAGFMAGSGLTIVINQLKNIFGIPNINTTEAPYLVFGKTLANLNHARIDAAFGVVSVVFLYAVKYLAQYLTRRYPQYARPLFFFSITRSIVVMVVSTLIAFLVNHYGHYEKSPIQIIGPIQSGFQSMGVPHIKESVLSQLLPDIPSIVVLLIMEHGAVSSSLGSISDYKVDISQEFLSLGVANIFGAFFCAYPGTGAFARTAVVSKSGARTPLSSFFVGIIVILSIYFFTPAFQYIPLASLSAIIAHSVTDLIWGPSVWKRYWDADPSELVIFACAYIISLFARIDIAVYVPIALSLVIQLYRTARPKYAVIGHTHTITDAKKIDINSLEHAIYSPVNHPTLGVYTQPIDSDIICFRPEENIVFQNSAFIFDKLLYEIKQRTRRGNPLPTKKGDRLWNYSSDCTDDTEKPLLHSVILDLSGVHQMDFTGMGQLVDAAVATERHTGHPVHWYIVLSDSLALRKLLLFAGFGQQRRASTIRGRFISDLQSSGNQKGHLPGIEGCSITAQIPKFDHSIEDDDLSGNQELRIENLKDVASSATSLDTHGASSGDSELCYCQLEPMKLESVACIRDRYPYFFNSIPDAAYAIFEKKRMNDSNLSSIVVESDGDDD
ncbi:sulfate permease [Backusella circina FSU 941]|nr:sulfate permease [Backusella circina FSU 941]